MISSPCPRQPEKRAKRTPVVLALGLLSLLGIAPGCAAEEVIGSAHGDLDTHTSTGTIAATDTGAETDTGAATGSTTDSETQTCGWTEDADYGSLLGTINVTGAGATSTFDGTCLDVVTPETIYAWTPPTSGQFQFEVCGSYVGLKSVGVVRGPCGTESSCGYSANGCVSTSQVFGLGERVFIVIEGGFSDNELTLTIRAIP